jgi:Mg-chelatase subunit ChlD
MGIGTVRNRMQLLRSRAGPIVRLALWAIVLIPGHELRCDVKAAVPRGKLDVVLMLDASGSMLKTDPRDLRYEGAKLLSSFLSDGDRLGVVRFAADAKVVRELEPVTPSTTGQLMERIRSIPAEGVFTDITEGVKVSAAMLEKAALPGAQRVVILLSDGKVEPDPTVGPAFARTLQLVQDMLPELKAKEIRVFTLALSDQADRGLLGEIAAATDGLTWYTQTAEEMHKSFAELFLALKRPQVIPQTGRGFSIDSEVDEATFYINRAPDVVLSLVSPKDETMTADKHPDYVMWFSGQNFDVITVKEPELGNWRVAGNKTEDGFATVLTDLKLLTDWPLVVRAGDEPLVQARLYEESKPVALPEMSGVVKFGFQIVPTDKISKPIIQEPLNDDGNRGDVVAQDGIFSSRTGSLESGAYKLTVVAKGPTFQRSQQIPFTVRPRLVTLHVTSPAEAFKEEGAKVSQSVGTPDEHQPQDGTEKRGELHYRGAEDSEFSILVSKEALTLKTFRVSLVALSEDRQVVDLPVKRLSPTGREYSAKAENLPAGGRYKIKALIKGADKKGTQVEAESAVIDFTFNPRSTHVASTEHGNHTELGEPASDESHSGGYRALIMPLTVVTAINLLGFVAVLGMFGKRKRSAPVVGQRYLPPAQMLEALEALEGRVSSTTVSPDDPIFKVVESMDHDIGLNPEQEAIDSGAPTIAEESS